MTVQTLKRKMASKPLPVVMAASGHPAKIDPLLTPQQLADMLSLPLESIYFMRHKGRAPKAILIGGRTLRFRLSDVQEWIRARESLAAGE